MHLVIAARWERFGNRIRVGRHECLENLRHLSEFHADNLLRGVESSMTEFQSIEIDADPALIV